MSSGPAEALEDDEPPRPDEALSELDRLVSENLLSAEKAGYARAKLLALKTAVERAKESERVVEERAEGLEARLLADSRRAEMAEDDIMAEELRLQDEVEKAEAEAIRARDRAEAASAEMAQLEQARKEAREKLEQAEADYAAAMAPQIEALQDQCNSIREQVNTERAKLHKAEEEVTLLRENVAESVHTRDLAKAELDTVSAELADIGKVPENLRRQNDQLNMQLKDFRDRTEKTVAKLKNTEAVYRIQAQQIKELTEEYTKCVAQVEKLRLQTETKARAAEELRVAVERERQERENHLADQNHLNLEHSAANQARIAAGDELTRRAVEKDKALKALKKAQIALEQSEAQLPGLRNTIENLTKDKAAHTANLAKLRKDTDAVRVDIEIAMDKFLKEETASKEGAAVLIAARKSVVTAEEELVVCKIEEREIHRALVDVEQQLVRVQRQTSSQRQKVRETQDAAALQENVMAELRKSAKAAHKRADGLAEMVEIVKRQRDQFKDQTKACLQQESEMQDKLRLINAELEVLRNQSLQKDALLVKAHKENNRMVAGRDKVRTDLGRTTNLYWQKQSVVEEQLAEIEVLNGVINAAEKEMLIIRKRYEAQVEQRNWAGLALIDRNDELCVLYEKSHVHEEVTLKAVLNLAKRQDEMRMIRIELAEAQRGVELTRRQLPIVPELDANVARLQAELLQTRRRREELSKALEDPSNTSRWRLLEGPVPTMEELRGKMALVEERLNSKRELLLEKSLVLEEVSALADRLRVQAEEGKGETLELAKKMNAVQAKLRAATRTIMASVAELSLYQATSIQMEEERGEVARVLDEARERFASGEAPTDDAEREWHRRLREEEVVRQRAAEAREAAAEEELDAPITTAEQRPTAYVPVGWAIPKPYGGLFPPMRPADVGSTMRHVRKPEPREIVL